MLPSAGVFRARGTGSRLAKLQAFMPTADGVRPKARDSSMMSGLSR